MRRAPHPRSSRHLRPNICSGRTCYRLAYWPPAAFKSSSLFSDPSSVSPLLVGYGSGREFSWIRTRSLSVGRSVGQSVSRSASQPARESVSQSVSQSISRSMSMLWVARIEPRGTLPPSDPHSLLPSHPSAHPPQIYVYLAHSQGLAKWPQLPEWEGGRAHGARHHARLGFRLSLPASKPSEIHHTSPRVPRHLQKFVLPNRPGHGPLRHSPHVKGSEVAGHGGPRLESQASTLEG